MYLFEYKCKINIKQPERCQLTPKHHKSCKNTETFRPKNSRKYLMHHLMNTNCCSLKDCRNEFMYNLVGAFMKHWTNIKWFNFFFAATELKTEREKIEKQTNKNKFQVLIIAHSPIFLMIKNAKTQTKWSEINRVINLPDSMSDSSFSLLEYKLSSVCSMPWNMLLPMPCIFHVMMDTVFFVHTRRNLSYLYLAFIFFIASLNVTIKKNLCAYFMLFSHYFSLLSISCHTVLLLRHYEISPISLVTLQFHCRKKRVFFFIH